MVAIFLNNFFNRLLFSDGLLFGTWIGLNDKNQEGTLQWSDGTPLSYITSNLGNDDVNDCMNLRKERFPKIRWSAENCAKTLQFICTKN